MSLTYSNYLDLPGLLATIQPVTPEQEGRVHAAEHFFIVTHQATELWLKQVLVDLDHAVDSVSGPDRDPCQAAEHVARAARITELLVEHVAVLRKLQPCDFASFRGRLGTASGAQSSQFRRLRKVLGLRGQRSRLCEELMAAAEENSWSLVTLYRWAPHGGPLLQLADAMTELSQAFWQWQLTHIEVVARAIGRSRGTGGTSGLDHLARTLEAPFPELWEARTQLQQPHRTAQPEVR